MRHFTYSFYTFFFIANGWISCNITQKNKPFHDILGCLMPVDWFQYFPRKYQCYLQCQHWLTLYADITNAQPTQWFLFHFSNVLCLLTDSYWVLFCCVVLNHRGWEPGRLASSSADSGPPGFSSWVFSALKYVSFGLEFQCVLNIFAHFCMLDSHLYPSPSLSGIS